MKPAPFDYWTPESLEHALALKAEHGDAARWLAGGQSLLPAMNLRLARPGILIDLNPLSGLDGLTVGDAGVARIGALVRYRALERDAGIARHQTLLAEAVPHVAHPQIRNRGTLCGNLAHADPASELPAVMLALGARLQARSIRGERWIDAQDFFVDLFTTALAPDELLAAVELPAPPPRSGGAFLEVARRRGDYAMMAVAAVIELAPDGSCTAARLAYGNAGPSARRAPAAEQALVGRRIDDAALREAAALAERAVDPPGSVHASPAFQRHLAGVLTRRAVATAVARVS
ncbi:MAG: xanthine dehydrogenase family protein subunit M [Proteobacteria bacterium]|nr:xanthine dehydrogenase family protein subunit M [Pseudomonadota bacterium]